MQVRFLPKHPIALQGRTAEALKMHTTRAFLTTQKPRGSVQNDEICKSRNKRHVGAHRAPP